MRKYSSIFPRLLHAASISLAALFIVVVGGPVFAQDTTGTNIGEVIQPDEYGIGGVLPLDVYAGCPPPEILQDLCNYYHPGSVGTSYCEYRDCFEMNYADEARLVAADERGFFPRTWFAWHSGELVYPNYGYVCGLKESGNKTRIEIPDELICFTILETNNHLYYWHFASNPESGCLGWFECRDH
jgi:hypothetical protein